MTMGLEGFKVRCQSCGTVLYETTKDYNCHKPLTGNMLRLLPFYKDWPCYDGSLAVESTSRFLMFCSNCSGYISTTGKLIFADFPDARVTEISEERSKLAWWETCAPVKEAHILHDEPVLETEVKVEPLTPEDMMEKIEKEATLSNFESKAEEASVASNEMKKLFQKKNKKRRKKRK